MSSDSNNIEYTNTSDNIQGETVSVKIESTKQGDIENSKFQAVIRALAANVGIALVKFVCFLFSSSSAMLAEAIHSGVDSFNSICLLVGIKRGARPADNIHPFGYGLEANVWAMFAALLMLAGTFVAIFHGIHQCDKG